MINNQNYKLLCTSQHRNLEKLLIIYFPILGSGSGTKLFPESNLSSSWSSNYEDIGNNDIQISLRESRQKKYKSLHTISSLIISNIPSFDFGKHCECCISSWSESFSSHLWRWNQKSRLHRKQGLGSRLHRGINVTFYKET